MVTEKIIKEISPAVTLERTRQGALIVDVREEEETHVLTVDVPDQLYIPLSVFDTRYTEIPKDREVILICRSGSRSARATGFLINHGYDPQLVINMKHGIVRWVRRRFPVHGDTSTMRDCCSTPGCC